MGKIRMEQFTWAFIMRHRSLLRDGTALIVLIAAMAAVAFIFDLEGRRSVDPRIDLNELLLLGIISGAGLAWFGWRRILEQEREIRSKTEAERRAEFLANHDHLTGLPNRRLLYKELQAAAESALAGGEAHALLLLDLNGFKRINDNYGHACGDEVLALVATRMSEHLSTNALLARTGGDEFAIVLRNLATPETAKRVAAEIIAALADPLAIGSDEHFMGTGIGIAFSPDHGAQPGELMRKADVALYKAKAQEGSHVAVYNEDMDREARERDHLQRDLASAIASGAIVPFYQPIVDLKTGGIRAFEALARWDNARLGSVPPAVFIPLAEESGLICELSDTLLERACQEAMHWPSDICLSFNVSPAMLREKTFALNIMRILGATGLAPCRLELEITETAITSDIDIARDNLRALHDAGLRIVLDDFGTGASSLAHLRNFKFDGIKIDRKFIDLMLDEEESATIVKAILGLANGLGLTIVAEGIEQMAQSLALQKEGCVTGQGYFFGKAVPANEIAHLFQGSMPLGRAAGASARRMSNTHIA